MKALGLLLFIFSILQSASVVKVEDRFAKSKNCKACHLPIVKEWEESWHARSHFSSDEYFRKTLKYVSKKTRKSLNGVKIDCAKCHNPRIAVTSSGQDYEIDAVMGLDAGSDVNKALADDSISEGINCVVCHNVNKIHYNKNDTVRGIDRVEWTPSGIMSGPFDDAKSPYHKVEHREFMGAKSNQLCFVCHANNSSVKKVVFSNMQKEYGNSKELCVDCHMGKKKLGIASTLRIENGKAKKRMVRSHGFKGAHFNEMIENSLSVNAKQKANSVVITLTNKLPHNVPSGFGSREVLLELTYLKGKEELKAESISLTTHYKDRRKKVTVAHLAKKMSKDMSVPAKGKKVLKVKKFANATSVKISVYYRLVNDEVRGLLKLKDAIWAKKMPITSTTLKLK